MNIRNISEQLNQPLEEVKQAAKSLFNPIPPTFTSSQIAQIEEYLSKKKHLPSTQSTQEREDLIPFNQQRTQNRIKRLYEAGSIVGKSEAQAFNAARQDAFLKEVQNDDEQMFYDFINGAIQHTVQNSHFARNVDRINGRKEVLSIDITSYEQPTEDSLKYLTETEDDKLARGWQKLLNPGHEMEP